ncbi:MAG TPA: trypsin-like peptidase domain-containing protein [Opitutaceae bacterium]|nr:trypsin-like peptidase domain-containing protein [Opitutaceae bacterium]
MRIAPSLALLLALTAAIAPAGRAMPESEATPGRLILRRYADAIVTVRGSVVLNVAMDERSLPAQESKLDVSGTVITPTGLVVTSFSLTDPKAIFESMRAKLPGGQNFKLAQSSYKDLRIVFGDGTELPVQVVWRDADRDVAMLAPANPLPAGRTLTCVNLNEAPAGAVVLGAYFEISRAGEVLHRTPMVLPCTVFGIVERPRRMLLMNTEAVGCPIFDTQGRALGICLRLVVNNEFSSYVVVPSSDLVDIASQITQL